MIIERLDSQPVPGKKKPIFMSIPQCKSKHSHEMIQTINAPLDIGFKNYLRIRCTSEMMSVSFQRLSDFLEVSFGIPSAN